MTAVLLSGDQGSRFVPPLSWAKKAQTKAHAQVAATNLQTTNRRHWYAIFPAGFICCATS